MKNILNKLMILLFVALAFPYLAASQNSTTEELRYEVNKIYPFISISKEKLKEANTLIDLNPKYKPSWVREYISVEISAIHQGRTRKAISKNNILSQEQKSIMNLADVDTDISVKVQYLPENTLVHNDAKEVSFTFTVLPESEASYPGGKQALYQYLKEKAIDKIPDSSFKNYDLSAVKFTINEDGEIINPHIFGSEYKSSTNEEIDELLLNTIRNMPCWKPAKYANGTTVKQEFALTVGNMENCVIHLLNIDQNSVAEND